jgi:hypothetical protein
MHILDLRTARLPVYLTGVPNAAEARRLRGSTAKFFAFPSQVIEKANDRRKLLASGTNTKPVTVSKFSCAVR